MDMSDYYFMEEFIFPEEGGVTGTCNVTCPHCGVNLEFQVDGDLTEESLECHKCNGVFSVNWEAGTVNWYPKDD